MTVQFANRQAHAPLDRRALRAVCKRLLRQHGADAGLSLCYVDDAAIRELNARFLGRDEPTDVLAFPLADDTEPDDPLLGEVVVSVETAVREAAARGLPVEAETALYTIHGVLHLLGYDDHDPEDVRRMRQAERQALEEAGLAAGGTWCETQDPKPETRDDAE